MTSSRNDIATALKRFIALASISSSFHVPLTLAYTLSSDLSTSLVTSTSELQNITNEFNPIISIESVGEDPIWFLSKVVFSDLDDPTSRNVTIHSSTVFYGFTEYEYYVVGPVCEAYYGDVKCSECTLCTQYPNIPSNPWNLNDGAVYFNCNGIQSSFSCTGTTGSSSDVFDSGTVCDAGSGTAQGISTCFVDDLPTPTATPLSNVSVSTRGVPSTSGVAPVVGHSGIIYIVYVSILGWSLLQL